MSCKVRKGELTVKLPSLEIDNNSSSSRFFHPFFCCCYVQFIGTRTLIVFHLNPDQNIICDFNLQLEINSDHKQNFYFADSLYNLNLHNSLC